MKKKLKFYFWSMAALGKGLSGSDRIFIELSRRFSKEHLVDIFLWEEGLKMCQSQNLKESSKLKFNLLRMGIWGKLGFLICYFARIGHSLVEAGKINLQQKKNIIYSSSEFWMDCFPALILKLRNKKSIWVAAWYQTAPNPLTGFSEGSREKKYRISALWYWLVQLISKPIISNYADLVLVNNEEEKKQFPKLSLDSRVQIMLGAVDLEKINKWQKSNKNLPKIYDAVFQGRFHPQKGVLELIDIWKLVVEQKKDAKLAMIGDGPLMQTLKDKIKKVGLEKNVKLFGYVFDGPEKYSVFAQGELVVHPAFYDSGGMAAAEAMAFGLPAVGFNLKSYESYYPKGMVKVEVGDTKGFANEIIKFLKDTNYRKNIGKQAQEMIQKGWSWDIRAEEILSKIGNLTMRAHKIKLPLILLFTILTALISLATFREGLNYDLRSEDWYSLWITLQPDLKDTVFQTLLFRDHPISTYQEVLLAPFFGFNPFYWYLFGYFTKVFGALAVGLMMWGITQSKKAAAYSGLIFAASVIGIETYLWVSVQSSAILIPIIATGVYFWIVSERENSLKKYLLAVFFYCIAFLGDPGRGISMLVLGPLWDFMSLIKNNTKKQVIKVILRNVFLIGVSALSFLFLGAGTRGLSTSHPSTLLNGLNYIAEHPVAAFNNFAVSIGNLVIGWFIPLFESDYLSSVSYPAEKQLIFSSLFFFLSLIFAVKFFIRRNNKFKIPLFFSFWVIIAFLPTWLLLQWYIGGLIPGVTGRYLAISSVGFFCLLGYGLSRLKKSHGLALLIIIILFNITTSNRILRQGWDHRSVLMHNRFWDEVDRTIPKGKNLILLFIGSYKLAPELASTHSIPLGLRRGINQAENLPITTRDRDLVKKLLCEEGVIRPNFLIYGPGRFTPILEKEKIPLARVYAWKFNEDSFVNVTDQERKLLKSEVNCKLD